MSIICKFLFITGVLLITIEFTVICRTHPEYSTKQIFSELMAKKWRRN